MRSKSCVVVSSMLICLLNGCGSGGSSGPSEALIRDDFVAIELGHKPGTSWADLERDPKFSDKNGQIILKEVKEGVKVAVTDRLTATNDETQTVTFTVTRNGDVETYSGQYKHYKEGWRLAAKFQPDDLTGHG
jgi:hypothetical protein